MTQTTTEREMPRLKARYRAELEQRLKDELELGNIMQVPRPVKVVVNMGIGEAIREARLLDGAVRDLTQITGQKPLVQRARCSTSRANDGRAPTRRTTSRTTPTTTKVFDEYEGFYTLLLKRVGAMAVQGKSLAEIKKELKMPEYADWRGQDRLEVNIDAAYRSVKK